MAYPLHDLSVNPNFLLVACDVLSNSVGCHCLWNEPYYCKDPQKVICFSHCCKDPENVISFSYYCKDREKNDIFFKLASLRMKPVTQYVSLWSQDDFSSLPGGCQAYNIKAILLKEICTITFHLFRNNTYNTAKRTIHSMK